MSYDAGSRGLAVKALARKGYTLPRTVQRPLVMASPPTVTSGTVQTLPSRVNCALGSGSYSMASSAGNALFSYYRSPYQAKSLAAVPLASYTPNTAGTVSGFGQLGVGFIHDGSDIELIVYSTQGMLIKVDDEYVSWTPTVVTSTVTYIKLAFGSRRPRRIDVIGQAINFVGVAMGWTDGLAPAPVRGPRVVVLGDSFSQIEVNKWTNWFGDCMGWDDVRAVGVGGTGYVATNGGASKKFRDRVATDVIPQAPDIVIVLGSLNDANQSAATIESEAALVAAQITAALPECLVIGGYNGKGGVETMPANALDAMDATRAGFVSGGGVWLNPIEMPLTISGAVPQTTVSSAVIATRAGSGAAPNVMTGSHGIPALLATNPATNGLPFFGGVIEVGTGAVRERIRVTVTTITSGIIYGFDGTLRYAHAIGEPMVLKGSSYLTGQGKVGTPTGFGNADLWVSADGVHPSIDPTLALDGHRALAHVMATLITGYFTQLTGPARLTGPGFAA